MVLSNIESEDKTRRLELTWQAGAWQNSRRESAGADGPGSRTVEPVDASYKCEQTGPAKQRSNQQTRANVMSARCGVRTCDLKRSNNGRNLSERAGTDVEARVVNGQVANGDKILERTFAAEAPT
ncbi:hypothetical protein R1flu_022396 [Riccia fluitans]|uniref:Uncharacterized protein n=1 Tax=Riccia fluitans TaxID=41844 RepID=A0ABD1ZS37_9MARC